MMDVGAEKYRPHSPHVQQLRGPNLSELDFKALRANRLARLQAKMKLHQIPVCLFPISVRERVANPWSRLESVTATATRWCRSTS